ncbi:hypothetical protein [Caballeronia sp. S22]|uniref:hypothetical protein n=1 Tax=Caballeronia sp. S22 TaxID=3137182 RepID=UPI003530DDA6
MVTNGLNKCASLAVRCRERRHDEEKDARLVVYPAISDADAASVARGERIEPVTEQIGDHLPRCVRACFYHPVRPGIDINMSRLVAGQISDWTAS